MKNKLEKLRKKFEYACTRISNPWYYTERWDNANMPVPIRCVGYNPHKAQWENEKNLPKTQPDGTYGWDAIEAVILGDYRVISEFNDSDYDESLTHEFYLVQEKRGRKHFIVDVVYDEENKTIFSVAKYDLKRISSPYVMGGDGRRHYCTWNGCKVF